MRRLGAFVAMVAGSALILPGATAPAAPVVAAAAQGGLDCNGYSPLQTTFRHFYCTEIAANDTNGFADSGHYVGHDGP